MKGASILKWKISEQWVTTTNTFPTVIRIIIYPLFGSIIWEIPKILQ